MNGVDLRFDLPAALGELEKRRRDLVRNLNDHHDELAEKLRTVAAVTDNLAPSVSSADAVIVTEHAIDHASGNVTFGLGTYSEYIQLKTPLPPGRYRALLLITRLAQ